MPSRQINHQINRQTAGYGGIASTQTSAALHPVNLPLKPRDLCVGAIVWLPKEDECEVEAVFCTRTEPHLLQMEQMLACCNSPIHQQGYSHPACIIGIKQRPGSNVEGDLICSVVLLYTWSRTDLQYYLENKHRLVKFLESIPIYIPGGAATTTMLDNYPFLLLGAGMMSEQAYVNFQHRYDVPIGALRAFSQRYRRAYDLRLDEMSYKFLMQMCRLEAEEYLDVGVIVSGATRRVKAWARADELAIFQKQYAQILDEIERDTAYASNSEGLVTGSQNATNNEGTVSEPDPISARYALLRR